MCEVYTAYIDSEGVAQVLMNLGSLAEHGQNTDNLAERILWDVLQTGSKEGTKTHRGALSSPSFDYHLSDFLLGLSAWLRGTDLNRRPLGYEPNELPDCSTPR